MHQSVFRYASVKFEFANQYSCSTCFTCSYQRQRSWKSVEALYSITRMSLKGKQLNQTSHDHPQQLDSSQRVVGSSCPPGFPPFVVVDHCLVSGGKGGNTYGRCGREITRRGKHRGATGTGEIS
ncbi:hypothetical protein BaRGS_00004469 [Batillaria attramentaria]|uniref:Uncharacterized protein n=1 Tax=Batillaria attramentaria TaxID=370345 RepID=A0ABD0LYB5_9CAEN